MIPYLSRVFLYINDFQSSWSEGDLAAGRNAGLLYIAKFW